MIGYIIGYKVGEEPIIPDPLGGEVEPEQMTDYLECTYVYNKNSYSIYEEGKRYDYTYEVIVDDGFMWNDVQLFDYHKKPLTKIIKLRGRPEYLDLMCKTKLYL